jgi:hypothetical protein
MSTVDSPRCPWPATCSARPWRRFRPLRVCECAPPSGLNSMRHRGRRPVGPRAAGLPVLPRYQAAL